MHWMMDVKMSGWMVAAVLFNGFFLNMSFAAFSIVAVVDLV
jgi:hypothetical protein